MKKILIIGGAGTIGLSLVKFLLTEGKYEITVLDLNNSKNRKNLVKYRNRINIIFGDTLDSDLLDNIIKDYEVCYYLASVLPPVSEYKKELSNIIEYKGLEKLIKAINFYNPKCLLIYGSSTSVIDNGLDDKNYFSYNKNLCEKLIVKKVKNYVIIRLPLVLSDLRKDSFIYNIEKNTMIECISKEDASYALCKIIDKYNELNKKIISIGGGASCICNSNELFYNILKYHGISFKYILIKIFAVKTYTSPVLKDSNESNKILSYRNDSLVSYFLRQKRRSKNRKIGLFFGNLLKGKNK